MKVLVKAEFMLFGVIKREGDWFVAHCPPLDIYTQGKTVDEAKNNLVEASELFIASCLERGTLEQALKELGYVPFKGKPRNIPNAFPIAIPIPYGHQKSLPCRA